MKRGTLSLFRLERNRLVNGIELIGGKPFVTLMFDIACEPHVAIRLQRLFGGARRVRMAEFRLDATPANAYELAWFIERHPMDFADVETEKAFRALVRKHKRVLEAIAEIEEPDYVPGEYPSFNGTPRDYQKIAADLALRNGALLIADQLGLGKTAEALLTLTPKGRLPALVVTPKHLARQWEAQIHRFLPSLGVHRIRRGIPYKFSEIKFEMVAGARVPVTWKRMPDVLIINYTMLNGGWVEALGGKIQTIIFEEAQELRTGSGTAKYDAAVALAERVPLKIGLSATPIYNYGDEIHNVLAVIAPDALGTRAEFHAEWCSGSYQESSGAFSNKVLVRDPAALGSYLREVGLMLRRTRKEVGRELPKLTVVPHEVDVDTARIHAEFRSVEEIANRILARAGTGFELMKMGGEIDYRLRQITGIGKAPAVADLVRLIVDAGETCLLFGFHHAVYDIWRAAFDRENDKIPYAMYTGDESDAQKAESVRRFIAGEAKVLIMSLRSGAGVDGLQYVCHTVVVGELDWSGKVIEQGIGRLDRDGQVHPVTAYICQADEGSDPVVADTMNIKTAQADGIVDPNAAGAHLVGSTDRHAPRLAEAVLRRLGKPIPVPVSRESEPTPDLAPIHPEHELDARTMEMQ